MYGVEIPTSVQDLNLSITMLIIRIIRPVTDAEEIDVIS
jgi:hypothetical protein